jgi:hypothetical protein
VNSPQKHKKDESDQLQNVYRTWFMILAPIWQVQVYSSCIPICPPHGGYHVASCTFLDHHIGLAMYIPSRGYSLLCADNFKSPAPSLLTAEGLFR